MLVFAFIYPYQLLTLKKKVTFRQLFSRPGPYDPCIGAQASTLPPKKYKVVKEKIIFFFFKTSKVTI